jgi:hypothetical protein
LQDISGTNVATWQQKLAADIPSKERAMPLKKIFPNFLSKFLPTLIIISQGIAIKLYHGDLSLLLVAVRHFLPSQIFANKAISKPNFYS